MRKPVMSESYQASPTSLTDKETDFQYSYPLPRGSRGSISALEPQSMRIDPQIANTRPPESDPTYRVTSPVKAKATHSIDDALASVLGSGETTLNPATIQQLRNVIAQDVLVALKAESMSMMQPQPVVGTEPLQSTQNVPVDSPTIDRTQVYTPPSPHRLDEPYPSIRAPVRVPTSIYLGGLAEQQQRELVERTLSPTSHAVTSDTDSEQADRPRRPSIAPRMGTEEGITPLERHWGRLFDIDGRPTEKLVQLLKGVAIHLIEEYEPRYSLVVTVEKLQRYYRETPTDNLPEIYPWKEIFDDQKSSLSRFYRKHKLEHHLVQQTELSDRPDVPALTPAGFAGWYILLIRAHPDEEYERLSKTIRDMAINNPDTNERFPKELSRRLFPREPETRLHTVLQAQIEEYCQLTFPLRRTSIVEPDSNYQPPKVEDYLEDDSDDEASETSDKSDVRTTERVQSTRNTGQQKRNNAESSSYLTVPSSRPTDSTEDDTNVATSQAEYNLPQERKRTPYISSGEGGRTFEVGIGRDTDYKNRSQPPISSDKYSRQRHRRESATERVDRRERYVPRVVNEPRSRTRSQVPESTSVHRTPSNSSHEPESYLRDARSSRRNTTTDSTDTRYDTRHISTSPYLAMPRRYETVNTYGSYSSSSQNIPFPALDDRHDSRQRIDYVPRTERSERRERRAGSISQDESYRPGNDHDRDRERERERDRYRDRDQDRSREERRTTTTTYSTPSTTYLSRDGHPVYPPSAYRETR